MIAPIEATGLGKRYGRTWALQDCSIRIPPGKIAALVGPNGAGKTTFLHLAAGLLRPTTGTVRIFGRTPQEHPLLLLDRVGFVAQDAPLYSGFSVEDTMRFGRELNLRWDQAAVGARLRALNIPFDRRISRLSGGQRSQVALALALGKRPELLLLDEPVARLDPLARREFMQGLTEAVAENGTSVLLSSHLVADLERVCDYLVIINSGQVQVAGEIDDVVLPALAGAFIGAPLVAREIENGTHRLAWTQGITRTSWIFTKLSLLFVPLLGAAALVGILEVILINHLGSQGNHWDWFDQQAPLTVAATVFALALGVASGAVMGRSIPAMAVTLLGVVAVRFCL